MTISDFCSFLGVSVPDIKINFAEIALGGVHPQDYCIKISCTTSGDVYWQFCKKGEVIFSPNSIELSFFKKFVSVVNNNLNNLNYEKDK